MVEQTQTLHKRTRNFHPLAIRPLVLLFFFPFFFISTYIHQLPLFVCLRDANSLSHTCTHTNDFSLSVSFPLLFLLLLFCLSDVCSMREHRWYTRQHGPRSVYRVCAGSSDIPVMPIPETQFTGKTYVSVGRRRFSQRTIQTIVSRTCRYGDDT